MALATNIPFTLHLTNRSSNITLHKPIMPVSINFPSAASSTTMRPLLKPIVNAFKKQNGDKTEEFTKNQEEVKMKATKSLSFTCDEEGKTLVTFEGFDPSELSSLLTLSRELDRHMLNIKAENSDGEFEAGNSDEEVEAENRDDESEEHEEDMERITMKFSFTCDDDGKGKASFGFEGFGELDLGKLL